MKTPWKRSIATLVLGGGIVLAHWMIVVATDDFVVVRPDRKEAHEHAHDMIRKIVEEDRARAATVETGSSGHTLHCCR
jgi:hypothetical protein